MITDDLLRVSESQDLGGLSDAAAVSTDKIDLGVARDIGEGKQLYAVFTVTEAFAGGTSTKFEIIAASDDALSADIAILGDSGAIATASLPLAKQLVVPIGPLVGLTGQRYLGARYTTVGNTNSASTNSAGKVTCDIVETIQDGKKFYTGT